MSTTYKSTISVQCWKEHTCVACECVYAYRFNRTVTGQSASEQQAIENAQKSALFAIQNDLDVHPCPNCGRYQPDMVAKRRRGIHVATMIGMLIVLAILLCFYLLAHGPSIFLAWTSTIAGLIGVAAVLLSSLDLLNGNLESNEKLARRRIRDGELEVIRDGHDPTGYDEPIDFRTVRAFWLAIGMMVIGALGISTAEWVRMLRGWTIHDSSPAVIGPGDEVKIYLNQSVNSIKGMWNGSAYVQALPVGNGPAENWPASSSRESWSATITVKSNERSSSSSLWVRVQIPDRPAMAGKRYRLNINLRVSYPMTGGFNAFNEQSSNFSRNIDVQLNSPGAGGSYSRMRWFGLFVGGSLFFVGLGVIYRMGQSYKELAPPTSAYADNR